MTKVSKYQMHMGRQPELIGGGLVRSAGGWSEVLSMRKREDRQFSDERILGGGEFVEDVLGEIGAALKEMLPMRLRIADAEEQLKYHCDKSGLTQAAL